MVEPRGAPRNSHVAIDGPAGSGKTTVARALAPRLGLLYLDTGAMYRALAFLALESGVDPRDDAALEALVSKHPISVRLDPHTDAGFRIYAGEEPLGDELYGNDVSRIVSLVAAHPAIRAAMVERQRAVAERGPVVMAGRDIGTVVLPEAAHKIFLTASVDERVERRRAELAAHGVDIDPSAMRAEIEERDRLDRERPIAPLRPAEGAVEIDSSGLPIEEVVARIAALVTGS